MSLNLWSFHFVVCYMLNKCFIAYVIHLEVRLTSCHCGKGCICNIQGDSKCLQSSDGGLPTIMLSAMAISLLSLGNCQIESDPKPGNMVLFSMRLHSVLDRNQRLVCIQVHPLFLKHGKFLRINRQNLKRYGIFALFSWFDYTFHMVLFEAKWID